MNYSETLSYLYDTLPMFSRLGAAAYKADLGNTITLCEFLGNPHQKIKTIHVAGTNGKGSVSHMLAAILQEAGFTTGLYTSPHLKDFRERIRINGIPCSEDFVVRFTEKMIPVIESVQPSFFEITVAMAFEYFASNPVDIAIIETGLGGRLDSTNIIHPLVSVITSIGWDHMQLLGNTLEAIAGEKAGIIKEQVPVVLGKMDAILYKVFQKKLISTSGENSNHLLYLADENWRVLSMQSTHTLQIVLEEKATLAQHEYILDLPGIYQQYNVACVLTTIRILQQMGYAISETHIGLGLQKVVSTTGLHGRWETLLHEPRVIADVAHNEDGIRWLVKQVNEIRFRQLILIIGMVKDKEVDKVLALLPAHATYFFTQASIPRALPAEQLADMAKGYNLKGTIVQNVNDALDQAIRLADSNDLILICGSVFLVGELNLLGTID
ncbi:MAG: folylpolyglutamate synthase/dihydrofolate synthase family protein [Chitinophagia bacterium]